jgi:hypothetical protein
VPSPSENPPQYFLLPNRLFKRFCNKLLIDLSILFLLDSVCFIFIVTLVNKRDYEKVATSKKWSKSSRMAGAQADVQQQQRFLDRRAALIAG